MTWNYKVIKRRHKGGAVTFGIHEVFYDDETDHPFTFTEDPIAPQGDSLKDLKKDFKYMQLAFDEKPIEEKDLLRRIKRYAAKHELVPLNRTPFI